VNAVVNVVNVPVNRGRITGLVPQRSSVRSPTEMRECGQSRVRTLTQYECAERVQGEKR
jgi:hypothetical protein